MLLYIREAMKRKGFKNNKLWKNFEPKMSMSYAFFFLEKLFFIRPLHPTGYMQPFKLGT
jgi:hypothetical protein